MALQFADSESTVRNLACSRLLAQLFPLTQDSFILELLSDSLSFMLKDSLQFVITCSALFVVL